MIVNAFNENVPRQAMEHRDLAPGEKEENGVLEFLPRPQHDMFVACLWSRWQAKEEDLYSFAPITNEPPAEVRAAGHHCCIVPITEANVHAWLRPEPGNLPVLHAILDDRDWPYCDRRMAS